MTRRGVLVYDGQAWHPFHTRLLDAHFSDTRLTYEDREGNIWVGLWGGGLVFCVRNESNYTTKLMAYPTARSGVWAKTAKVGYGSVRWGA